MSASPRVSNREPVSAFRRYGVSPEAEAQGRALGYSPDDLADRARRAARYRGNMATHRFQDLAFDIADNTILGVHPLAFV